jgi:hypothetical protein
MSERDPQKGVLKVAAPDVMDVARDLLGELDVELVLEHVLESARELTGARSVANRIGAVHHDGY